MKLGALLIAGCLTLQAQTRPAAPKPQQPPSPANWVVEVIAVEGNKRLSEEQVIAASGLRVGLPAGRWHFDAARDRLLNSGYFASVAYRFEPAPGNVSYFVSLEVVEVDQIFPWRIEDLPVTPQLFEEQLRRRDPLFGEKIPATEPVLQRYARALEDILARQGQPLKVVAKLEAEKKDELKIVFRPATLRPTVAEVHFTGNSTVDTGILRQALGPTVVGTPFSEPRFRESLEYTVKPVYEARGRIRVSFPKITTEPAKDVNGLIVNVAVNEGEVYKLTAVAVEGAPLEQDEIGRIGDFRVGETANYSEVGKGIERVLEQLRNRGYLKASYKAERRANDEAKTVSLKVFVDPGPQYTFSALKLIGLDIHTEPVVRKLWALKPGDPFNKSYPQLFLSRIESDGVFDNLRKTKAETNIDEAAKTVQVVLRFN